MKSPSTFSKASKNLRLSISICALLAAPPVLGGETIEQITDRAFALAKEEKYTDLLASLQDAPPSYRSDYHFAYFQALALFGQHQSGSAKYWAETCLRWMKSDGESEDKQKKIAEAMTTMAEREAAARPPIIPVNNYPEPRIFPIVLHSGGSTTQYVVSSEVLRISYPALQEAADPGLLNHVDPETKKKFEMLVPPRKFDSFDFQPSQDPTLPKLDTEALKKLLIENRGGSGNPTK